MFNFNEFVKTGMQVARDLYERVKESVASLMRFANNLLESHARIAAVIQIFLVYLAPIVFVNVAPENIKLTCATSPSFMPAQMSISNHAMKVFRTSLRS